MPRLPLHSYAEFTRRLGDREYFGAKLGLDRMRVLLGKLFHPERKFPSIHIAGTNGKGSTAYLIEAILMQTGYRAGLYTSPHLEDFCERIQVGGQRIRPEQVLHWARVIQEVEEEPLTFFEMVTVIALLHFAEEKVPVAILETGLGGRLDATNVVMPLVSVITTIGLDHQQHLGSTLEAIALEKAGIIKERVPVVCGVEQPDILALLTRQAAVQQAPLISVKPLQNPVGPKGEHQRRNAALAVEVVRLLRKSDYFISEEAIERGLAVARVPGRLEEISSNPRILLDGAHNVPAADSLAKFLAQNYPGTPIHLLFGVMADKDWQGMLQALAPHCCGATFVRPTLRRAEDPFRLQEVAQALGLEGEVIPNVPQALQRVMRQLPEKGLLLVTGSFFTVGEARRYLRHSLARLKPAN